MQSKRKIGGFDGGTKFFIVVGESEYILMLGVALSKYSNSRKNEALLTDL